MPFEQQRYWLFTLDPVHVGSGRQQISRIDLPAVRETGTDLPAIPGTSIGGICRAYAAMGQGGKTADGQDLAETEAHRKNCAGKGGPEGAKHCGKCKVCQAFGFSKGPEKTQQGKVQIHTAHILLFPIATALGPVWITSRERLSLTECDKLADLPSPGFGEFVSTANITQPRLNFGWMYLKKAVGTVTPASWIFPAQWKDGTLTTPTRGLAEEIKVRTRNIALVHDDLFPTLVNDNMEVRTLVSIDPKTGAAEEGALFTYEAIPRGTVLWGDICYAEDVATYGGLIDGGFALMKFLGLGGMNTRGMGRVEYFKGGA